MDLEKYFKKNYQKQLISIQNNHIEQNQKIKNIKFKEKSIVDDNLYNSSEEFYRINISNFNGYISKLLSTINKEKSYNNIISNQLVLYDESNPIDNGNYYIGYPFALKISKTNEKVSEYIKKNKIKMILINCIDLEYLLYLGKNSFAESLKLSGEILYLVKKFCNDNNIYISDIKTNFNFIAHLSNININKVFILDCVGIGDINDVIS